MKIVDPLQFQISWEYSSVPNALVMFDDLELKKIKRIVYFKGAYIIENTKRRVWTVYEDRFSSIQLPLTPRDETDHYYHFNANYMKSRISAFQYNCKFGVESSNSGGSNHEGIIGVGNDLTQFNSIEPISISLTVSTKYPTRIRLSSFLNPSLLTGIVKENPLILAQKSNLSNISYFSYKTGSPLSLSSPIIIGDYLLSGNELRRCTRQILRAAEYYCGDRRTLNPPFAITGKFKWFKRFAVFDSHSSSPKKARSLGFLNLESGDFKEVAIPQFIDSNIKIINSLSDYFLIAGLIQTVQGKAIEIIGYSITKGIEPITIVTSLDDETVLGASKITIEFEESLTIYYMSQIMSDSTRESTFVQIKILQRGENIIKEVKKQQEYELLSKYGMHDDICGYNNSMILATRTRFQLISFSDNVRALYQLSLKPANLGFENITRFECLDNGRVAIIWDDSHFMVADLDNIIRERFYPFRMQKVSNAIVEEIYSNKDQIWYMLRSKDGSLKYQHYPMNLWDSIVQGDIISDKVTIEFEQLSNNSHSNFVQFDINIDKDHHETPSLKAICRVEDCYNISNYADKQGKLILSNILEFKGPRGEIQISDNSGDISKKAQIREFYESQEIDLPQKAIPLWLAPLRLQGSVLIAARVNEHIFKTMIFKMLESGEAIDPITNFDHSCEVWGSRDFGDSIIFACRGNDRIESYLSIAKISNKGFLIFNKKIKTRLLNVYEFDAIYFERCELVTECLTLIFEDSKRHKIHITEIRNLMEKSILGSTMIIMERVRATATLRLIDAKDKVEKNYLVLNNELTRKANIQRLKGFTIASSKMDIQEIGPDANFTCYFCKDDICACGADGLYLSLLKTMVHDDKFEVQELHKFRIYKNIEIQNVHFSSEQIIVVGKRIKDLFYKDKLYQLDTSGVFIYDIPKVPSPLPIEVTFFISGAKINSFGDNLPLITISAINSSDILLITDENKLMRIERKEPLIDLNDYNNSKEIAIKLEPGGGILLARPQQSDLEPMSSSKPDASYSSNQESREDRSFSKRNLSLLILIIVVTVMIIISGAFFALRRLRRYHQNNDYTESISAVYDSVSSDDILELMFDKNKED